MIRNIANWLKTKYMRRFSGPEAYHQYFSSDGYDIHEVYHTRGMDETSRFIEHQLRINGIQRCDKILEIGCNMGRHLNYLFESGYNNLSGIELNENALTCLKESYPDLYNSGSFYRSSVEEIINEFSDNEFDAIYSITVFQHIPKKNDWIFEEVARITDGVMITVELEDPVVNDWIYEYRDYKDIFQELGFNQLYSTTAESAPVADHLKSRPHIIRIFRSGDTNLI